MGRILDISGQPFDFDDEMQTRSDELAMVMKRTQEHPSSGVTPNRAAQMLRDAERGDASYHGLELQPFGWFMHRAKSRTGYVGTNGLVRTLIWPFIFKNYSVRDFAEFLEIYGLPMRVGKYPTGSTNREKATLMQAVMDIGRRAGGIIPMGMTLDFQSAADGQSDPFMAMIGWAEKAISKAILGGTLTTEAGDKGARSLGEVHDEVRREIRNADVGQLARSINRDLIYPLLALNSDSTIDINRLPGIVFDTSEAGDITALSDAIPKLAAGMRIPVIDGEIAGRLVEGVRALNQDVLIDYEHNQLRKDKGLPPEQLVAAGWFNADEMQWREGEGLFIHPRWTAAAQQRIDDGEFGYLSAVFPYDTATGAVLQIRLAALTNDPGATGMKKLTALAADLPDILQQENKPMNETLRKLLARLGVTVPENADITDEQASAALSALDALETDAGKVASLSAELEKAQKAAVDLTKYVPVESYNALRDELAAEMMTLMLMWF
ncbi:TPA: phage portal protein family protein [Escherichia coli]